MARPRRWRALYAAVWGLIAAAGAVADHQTLLAGPENASVVNRAADFYRKAGDAAAAGDPRLAIQRYRECIQVLPTVPGAYNNLAMLLLHHESDAPQAMKLLRRGLEVATAENDAASIASIHQNMGYIVREVGGRFSVAHGLQAIEHFDAALAVNPTMIEALSNKGLTLVALHRLDEAEQVFHRALAVDPTETSALLDLAFIYFERGELERCLQHLDEIIARPDNPNYMSAIGNKAVFLREAGYITEALETQMLGLKVNPNDPRALSNIMTMQRVICDWKGLEALEEHLVEMVKKQELSDNPTVRGVSLLPYDSTLVKLSDAFRRQLAEKYAATFDQSATVGLLPSRWALYSTTRSRLRVGYISYDFRAHPMGHLTLALIDSHNRKRVEVYCFSYGPDDRSEWRRRIEDRCDVFRDIRQLPDLEAAHQIARDQPDLLIDLMAHTKGARQGITALLPSPIVVNYLGFPGTTGAKSTHFSLVDKLVLPPEVADVTMAESVVYLPTTYQANQYEFDVDVCGVCTSPYERSNTALSKFSRCVKQCQLETRPRHHLPKDALVFCNFNVNNKMDAASFGLWMDILRQVPGSVLWLLSPRLRREKENGGDETSTNVENPEDIESTQIMHALRSQAASMGIAPSRIIFAPQVSKYEHLSRIALADLFLDSLVYNAHSTASDVLWAHVPIVTLWGDTFPSRVAASLIENAVPDIPEIIPFSLKDYETTAVELARDTVKRLRLRAVIARQSLTSPLFDTTRTVHGVETALEVMHDVKKLADDPNKELSQIYVLSNRSGDESDHTQARLRRIAQLHDDLLRNESTKAAKNVKARLVLSGMRADLLNPDSFVSITSSNSSNADSDGKMATQHTNELIELWQYAENLISQNQTLDHLAQVFEDVEDHLLRLAIFPTTSASELERVFLMFTLVFHSVGRTFEAIGLAIRVLELQPSFFRLRLNLGAMLGIIGNYDAANMEQAIAADTESRVRFTAWLHSAGNDKKLQQKLNRRPIGKPVIAIYCNEYSQDWWGDWGPSSTKHGLGGSEEAVVHLSQELARLGYYVEVYASPPPQDDTFLLNDSIHKHANDPSWYPLSGYDPDDQAVDVFIAWRYPISLIVGKHARRAIYWAHDIPAPETVQSSLLVRLAHRIVCVSEYQASHFSLSLHSKIVVLRNGVDPAFFTDGPNTNNVFMYASAPNRGLGHLLLAWPIIRAKIPEAKLQIFYGFTPAFEKWAQQLRWPVLSLSATANETTTYNEWRTRIDELLHVTPGVEFIGLVGHERLAQALANGGFWVYPTSFSETSCISAMKAMANGAIPISSRFTNSALNETIGAYDQGPLVFESPEQIGIA